jgi:Gluconate 2-dehydrogenase subunit 3
MDEELTRRQFLDHAVKSSLLLAAGAAMGAHGCSAGDRASATGASSGRSGRLTRGHRELLSAAMDEIIPEGDGMPSASAVGGVEYLERLAAQVPSFEAAFEEAATTLDALSHARFGGAFLQLARAERVQALLELERRAAPEAFQRFRDAVYEAYYTNSRVWALIGYDPWPTDRPGPRMKPFDEALLARVKGLPARYREVG